MYTIRRIARSIRVWILLILMLLLILTLSAEPVLAGLIWSG
jgi:hypothetical protein